MKRYPYEGLVVTVGTAVIITPISMWLYYGKDHWSLPVLLLACLSVFLCFVPLAYLLDKQDAAQKKEAEQQLGPVLDLSASDFRDLSSHETQEPPDQRGA